MADKNIFEKLFLEAEKKNLQVLMDNALTEKINYNYSII